MHDVIIIGAGPAGLTAGLYTGRARLATLMLEKMVTGGRILMSETIENYPGFPAGVSTQELMRRMEEQVKELQVEIKSEEVLEIDCAQKSVKTEEGAYKAKAIIIAAGSRPRKLGVPGEEQLTGRGLSYCATCDGPLYKGKNVVVVGGGNAVAEEAIYLTRFAARVDIVHRRDELRASAILQEQLKANKKINFILSHVVTQISGSKKVESIKIKDLRSQEERDLACDGVFIYIGYDPETDFLKNKLHLDDSGFIITGEDMAASEEGIFACGDCRKKSLRQVITACGDGAIAAESAYKYISKGTTYGAKRT
ncbi:MAG: thioredoxin-disulfide reductase [Candidatus Omnitrophica bacterium]|nr:thioredoxin-disulfide reductase [Candidatus Omnitrophota bacterium]